MIYLKDIVELFAGYSFRGKVEPEKGGQISVIQLKDLEDNYSFIGDGLVKITGKGIKDKYYLQNGDVLFISKGVNNYAIPFYRSPGENAVASSTFFVFRPKLDVVVPGYLAWFLNHPNTQNFLKSNLAGTYTLNLNRSAIEQIEIVLPSMGKQQAIAQIDRLHKMEKRLTNQLTEKRTQYLQTTLFNAIK